MPINTLPPSSAEPGVPRTRHNPRRGMERAARQADARVRIPIEFGDDRRVPPATRGRAALDGIHVIRTSLDADSLGPDDAVDAYKSLATAERAFRQIKTGRQKVRPVFVHSEAHARTHVFMCMLVHYVEWHTRRRLAPVLFDEDDPEAAKAQRASPVAPAQPSPSARSKAASKRTRDGAAAHSLHTLLADLSTVALNDVSVGGSGSFKVVTTPTPGQRKAFELLGVDPAKMFPAAGR